MIHPIHQSDIEKQAHATESTTEAVIITRNDIVEAIKAIPKTIIPESKDFPEFPEFPTEMAVSLKGVSLVSIKGDKGNSPTKEELLGLINPLIPEPIKGEDADNERIIEELTKRIPEPIVGKTGDKGVKGLPGKDGKDGLNGIGKDGKDGIEKEPETGNTILEKLNPIKNSLNFEILTNIPDFALARDVNMSSGIGGGGGPTLTFQDEGIRITDNPITTFNVIGSVSALTYSGNGIATLDMSAVSTTYVPYTGATQTVDFTGIPVLTNGFAIYGAGQIDFYSDSGVTNIGTLTSQSVGILSFDNPYYRSNLDFNGMTIERTFTFPDASGTIALTSDLSTKLNTSGGTMTGGITNSTSINPLTTLAESWIGPSSTTGIYFKGGNVGIGTTTPTKKLEVSGTTLNDIVRSEMGFDIGGVVKPTTLPVTLTAGGTNLGIGTYYYWISYYTALGETGLKASAGITTDAGNRKVTLTLQTSTDHRVIGRKLYRGIVGDPSYHAHLLTTIANNVDTTYIDDIPDGSLGVNNIYWREDTTTNYLSYNGAPILMAGTGAIEPSVILGANTANNVFSGAATGGANTFLGNGIATWGLTSGNKNVGVGFQSLQALTSGGGNVAIGWMAGGKVTSGGGNVAIGNNAGVSIVSGGSNTMIGFSSGVVTTGSNNNFYGYFAGAYETGSDKLIIDSRNRVDEARSRSESLIYGITSATPANQILSLGGNGNVGIGTTSPTAKLHLPASQAGANLASLKIPSGVVATTAVSGNIESDGTHLYWTDSGGTRRQLDN